MTMMKMVTMMMHVNIAVIGMMMNMRMMRMMTYHGDEYSDRHDPRDRGD